MRNPWLGIVLAVAASVALNGSFVLQHAGSARAPAITPRRPVAVLRGLLASPRWAVGAAAGMAGWALHVGALARAPVSLVQAFVAGGVVLTIPMAVLGLGHRVSGRERRAVALTVAGLVALGLGQRAAARPSFSTPVMASVLGGVAAAAAVLAWRARGARQADALGLAGGTLYAAADLAFKGVTAVWGRGDAAAGLPWLVAGLAATAGAFFAFQRGLQIGRPVTVIALMTAATNVTAIAGGFAVFGDPLGRTPLLQAAHAAGFLLVGLSGWALAPAQAAPEAAPVRVATASRHSSID